MKTLHSVSWVGSAQVANLLLQFAASVALSRLLSRNDVGVYYAALAAFGLLNLFQATGLRALVIRAERLDEELARTAFTINVLISVFMSVTVSVMSALAGWFLRSPEVARVMLAMAVVPLISAFELLPSAKIERQGEFKLLSIISITSSAGGAAAAVLFAMAGARYMSAAYASWLSALLSLLAINVVGWRHTSFRPSLRHWRSVSRFGLQMLLTAGVHVVGDRTGELILGRVLGVAQLGVYSRAAGLNNQVWNNLHIALGRVAFVDFARLHREGLPLRERYLKTVEVVTATLWPAFGGLAVLAGPFVTRVYGERWADAAAPLSLLCIASMVLISITMTWEVFSATGNLAKQTKLESINAGVAVILTGAASIFGLRWAAAARIAAACFAVCLYRRHLGDMTGTSRRDLGPIYLRSLLATVLAVGPSAAVMCVSKMSPHTHVDVLAAAIAIGVLLWIGLLWVTRHPLFQLFTPSITRVDIG